MLQGPNAPFVTQNFDGNDLSLVCDAKLTTGRCSTEKVFLLVWMERVEDI